MRVVNISKETHIARDFDKDELGYINLHENQELMKSTKDVADRAHVDPFVAIDA